MRKALSDLLHPQFIKRWSPRSMLSDPIPEAALMAMFEAAHWAPSCFNEQPWRFVFAREAADRARFLEILDPGNQAWAHRAPVLVVIFTKNYFDFNQALNVSCQFDAGSAWMALSLQAMGLGYYAHAMAGFNREQAYTLCGVDPKHYQAMAVIAIGKRGEPDILSEDLKAMESPNSRNPLSRSVFEAHFNPAQDQDKIK